MRLAITCYEVSAARAQGGLPKHMPVCHGFRAILATPTWPGVPKPGLFCGIKR